MVITPREEQCARCYMTVKRKAATPNDLHSTLILVVRLSGYFASESVLAFIFNYYFFKLLRARQIKYKIKILSKFLKEKYSLILSIPAGERSGLRRAAGERIREEK